ncbi:MAG: CrtD protein, partial [Alphaproteobacteria bacterium]|nr:CrtD protein [Alphaproteobacteria bacterium]
RGHHQRSLSALTIAMLGRPRGFDLHHHNVFFCPDYKREFDDIFLRGVLPDDPTVYICAQDRGGLGDAADRTTGASPAADERLFAIINAPPTGDITPATKLEVDRCLERTFNNLRRYGLELEPANRASHITAPADFNRLFPATGGALYGTAMHGSMAAFQRPTSRTRIKGLYLAGGSIHPGPGLPMTATSGRMAASALLSDLASTRSSHQVVTRGGISTRSATTLSRP